MSPVSSLRVDLVGRARPVRRRRPMLVDGHRHGHDRVGHAHRSASAARGGRSCRPADETAGRRRAASRGRATARTAWRASARRRAGWSARRTADRAGAGASLQAALDSGSVPRSAREHRTAAHDALAVHHQERVREGEPAADLLHLDMRLDPVADFGAADEIRREVRGDQAGRAGSRSTPRGSRARCRAASSAGRHARRRARWRASQHAQADDEAAAGPCDRTAGRTVSRNGLVRNSGSKPGRGIRARSCA